jgi:hypothetical protein
VDDVVFDAPSVRMAEAFTLERELRGVPLEPIWRVLASREDGGHKLWTDDYWASFAQAADLALATLDGTCSKRYPSVRIETLR